MVNVITKKYRKNSFYISGGWNKKSARKFHNENKKAGIYSKILTNKQAQKVRRLRKVSIPAINKIKRLY